jgi:hypothetical protein
MIFYFPNLYFIWGIFKLYSQINIIFSTTTFKNNYTDKFPPEQKKLYIHRITEI